MDISLSIVMPCLNEAKTLAIVIAKAKEGISKANVSAEILVVDNGSTDNSVEIAEREGARVVRQVKKGYGSALRKGLEEAKGKYIIMGDADDTYDFSKIEPFIEKLEDGVELVMGSRLRGNIAPKAMPFLHRYVGNPVLTCILNFLFRGRVSDTHCGLRGFRKDAIMKLNLRSDGMEFASEMIVKALNNGLRIEEFPIDYHASPVERKPHLRSFSDGWRHLRFMLIFSPTYIFLMPGIFLLILGVALLFTLMFSFFYVFNLQMGLSAMIFSSSAIFIGYQFLLFGISSKLIGVKDGLIPESMITEFVKKHFRLEKGLIIGAGVLFTGLLLWVCTVYLLFRQGSSPIVNIDLTKMAILSTTFLLFGIQTVASSFYLGMLDIETTLK